MSAAGRRHGGPATHGPASTTDTDAALRASVAALTARERAALISRFRTTATVARQATPDHAPFWNNLAALVAEVDQHERARSRGEEP